MSKEKILEAHFGSDYYLLKERGDLIHVLNAMEEYASEVVRQNALLAVVSVPLPCDEEIEKELKRIILFEKEPKGMLRGWFIGITIANWVKNYK